MDPHGDDFGPYQEGEDEIAGTYDTPDEFAAAMRAWVKGHLSSRFSPHNGPVGPDLPRGTGRAAEFLEQFIKKDITPR